MFRTEYLLHMLHSEYQPRENFPFCFFLFITFLPGCLYDLLYNQIDIPYKSQMARHSWDAFRTQNSRFFPMIPVTRVSISWATLANPVKNTRKALCQVLMRSCSPGECFFFFNMHTNQLRILLKCRFCFIDLVWDLCVRILTQKWCRGPGPQTILPGAMFEGELGISVWPVPESLARDSCVGADVVPVTGG